MELTLNLAGALVALAMVCLWLRLAPHAGVHRRTQIVALALLILVLFPVISVTDDLLAAQNPAETSSSARRHHVVADAHAAFPAAAGLPQAEVAGLSARGLSRAVTGALPLPASSSPALAPIESRPPPAA